MALTLHKTFTAEQREKLGPAKRPKVLSTERYVYHTPFLYENVEVGDFYEVGSAKGIEFKADTGFITIREEQPIIAVTVVGSGCTPRGYNICEWWEEGESVDNIQDQLVKRQRVDNLNGTHPSIWTRILTTLRDQQAPQAPVSIEATEPDVEFLRVAPDGHIWILTSRAMWDPPEGVFTVFDVFSPDGHFVEQVQLVVDGDPLDFGRDATPHDYLEKIFQIPICCTRSGSAARA